MAIVNMVDPFTPGSRLGHSESTTSDGYPVTHLYGLTDTYVGACISESERNGYHDSDFYMQVWDEAEGKVKSICFASTRGWSYPCLASKVDATPEVLAKVEAYRQRETRRNNAADIRAARKEVTDLAGLLSISRSRAARLVLACGDSHWKLGAVTKLLTSALRSPFRIKLREQVRSWLADAAPQYESPLSPKQWNCIHPDAFSTAPRGGYKSHYAGLAADLRHSEVSRRTPTYRRLAGL